MLIVKFCLGGINTLLGITFTVYFLKNNNKRQKRLGYQSHFSVSYLYATF